ncbi:MAG TPA: hypothetical protein PKY87_10420 [Terricaulis sp.]|nr:hypothetical protein [Terricaulis sp.]
MTRLVFVVVLMLAMFAPGARAQDSDSLTWARANSCDSIRDYIARYPSGRHLTAAREQLRVRNCPDPNRPAPQPRVAQPQPQPQPQGDPCQQARTDWPAAERSTSLPVVRAYRDGLPAACGMWRARAEERITALEAEARRRQSEQQAAAQRQQEQTRRRESAVAAFAAHSRALLPAFEALAPYGTYKLNCSSTASYILTVTISRRSDGARILADFRTGAQGADVYLMSVNGGRFSTFADVCVGQCGAVESTETDSPGAVPLNYPWRDEWQLRGNQLRHVRDREGPWLTRC